MQIKAGEYLVIARSALPNIEVLDFFSKERAIDDARHLSMKGNTDYVVLKIEGIMQAIVRNNFVEGKE